MTKETSNAETTEQGAAAEEVYGELKEWAVLVYLGGQNNLFDEMVFAVKEMKSSVPKQSQSQQGNKFNFHAMIQFGAEETARPTSAFPLPRRFILTPGDEGLGGDFDKEEKTGATPEQSGKPSSPIKQYKKELVNFLVWGITKGRAKNYLVIFSGHGRGIETDFLSQDTTPPQSLTVKDFRAVLNHWRVRAALKKVGKSTIDILGLDSCLMAMAEVGFELRREVPLMISSQGSQANLGWPYQSIFAWLHGRLNSTEQGYKPPTSQEITKAVMRMFVAYYDDFACAADSSADISACRLRDGEQHHMEDLKEAVDSLADVCLDIIGQTDYQKDLLWEPADNFFARALIFAHWYAQTYHSDQYVDIQDFCGILAGILPRCDKHDGDSADCDRPHCGKYQEVRQRCEHVIDVIKACTLDEPKRMFSGPLYQYSHGLSIYLPWSEIYKLYNEAYLDFLEGGCWHEFVKAYTVFTRRPPRRIAAFVDRLYQGTKDFPPRSKGPDDPSQRAKNPPSLWKAGENYYCALKPPVEDKL